MKKRLTLHVARVSKNLVPMGRVTAHSRYNHCARLRGCFYHYYFFFIVHAYVPRRIHSSRFECRHERVGIVSQDLLASSVRNCHLPIDNCPWGKLKFCIEGGSEGIFWIYLAIFQVSTNQSCPPQMVLLLTSLPGPASSYLCQCGRIGPRGSQHLFVLAQSILRFETLIPTVTDQNISENVFSANYICQEKKFL